MREAKVLVGGIASIRQKQTLVSFLKGLKGIEYGSKEIFLLDASGEGYSADVFESVKGVRTEKAELRGSLDETMACNRNRLAEHAVSNGFDFLLLVDLEQAVPRNAITGLLQHGKKVCSCLCLKPAALKISKGKEEFFLRTFHPLAAKKAKGGELAGLELDAVLPSRLMQVNACFLGCMLIHKSVLEKMEFRFEENKKDFQCFAEDCKKHGFAIWLDSSLVCRNIGAKDAI